MSEALFAHLPTIIKARTEGDRRLVDICASSQDCDGEGDVILQSALLESSNSFIKTGALDEDHISEIGHRLGVPDPASYLIGVPLEVKDLGNGKTGVLGQLHKGRPRAEAIWDALTADPPIPYQASIYGFPLPGAVVDARVTKSKDDLMGASRFLVRSLDWRSLALTRNPVNTALDRVKVITAKSYVAVMKSRILGLEAGLTKGMDEVAPIAADYILPPRNREEMMGHYLYHIKGGRCPFAGNDMGNSVFNFRNHFACCCGDAEWEADLKALALMHLLKRESRS